MKHYTQNRVKVLISACMLLLMATVAWSQQPSLRWLGTLGGDWSAAFGVSQDGSVVVGRSRNRAGREIAFRWTASGGMRSLGTFGGDSSGATAVSADGTIVVGWAYDTQQRPRAFRWQNNRMQDLGTLGGDAAAALGISADGSVIVGWAADGSVEWRACRWTASGAEGLIADRSKAWDVSDDGNVIVGTRYLGYEWGFWLVSAFRLQGSQIVEFFGILPELGEAYGVSADGNVMVGEYKWCGDVEGAYFYIETTRAFRATWPSGMRLLSTFGRWEAALDVSADGSVVVGYSDDRACRWTQAGVEDLSVTYASLLIGGSRLISANAISRDGRYIVGEGFNAATRRREAFLLDTGPPCTPHNGDVDNNRCIDDADLLAVLFAFGNTGSDLGRVDVNCDGVVDDADLLQVLFNFGSGC